MFLLELPYYTPLRLSNSVVRELELLLRVEDVILFVAEEVNVLRRLYKDSSLLFIVIPPEGVP